MPRHLASEQLERIIKKSYKPWSNPPVLGDFKHVFEMPLRFSDTCASGFISHEGLARHMEDARISLMAAAGKLQGSAPVEGGMLVRLTLKEFAKLYWPGGVTAGVGVRYVGDKSYCFSIACFQNGQLVAYSESVNVVVDLSTHRPISLSEQDRTALQGVMVNFEGDLTPDSRILPNNVAYEAFPFKQERSPRFSDSDLVGHINNVAVVRHYQDALMELLVSLVEPVAGVSPDRQLSVLSSDTSYFGEAHIHSPLAVGFHILAIEEDHIIAEQKLFQNGKGVGERQLKFGFTNVHGTLLAIDNHAKYLPFVKTGEI